MGANRLVPTAMEAVPRSSGASAEFYHPTKLRAGARIVRGVPRERAIRLYCVQAGSLWNLQIRGPQERGNYSEGKEFIVATAPLCRDELVALRDAIDTLLTEDA